VWKGIEGAGKRLTQLFRMEKINHSASVSTCTNPECMQHFSLPAFRIAAFLYGVIFLIGRKDGYVGIVCPKCLNTTLQKYGHSELFNILSGLGKRIFQVTKKEITDDLFKISENRFWGIINEEAVSDYEPFTGGLLSSLEYNTFQHNPEDLLPSFNSPYNHRHSISSYEDYGYMGEKKFSIRSAILRAVEASRLSQLELQKKIDGQDYYISYSTGVHINGSYLKLFGFKGKEIPNLLKIENEYKKKIFPRHFYHSQIRESCKIFCKNKHIRRIIDSIRPIDLLEYKKKGGGIETILKAGTEKEQMSISSAFMDLLKDDEFSISIHPKAFRLLSKVNNIFKIIDFSKPLSGFDLSSYIETLHDGEKNYADMYDRVWISFKKDPMQLELIKGAIDFAITYRQYAKRTDWSDSSIWNFKRDYLNGLFKYSRRIPGNKLIPEEIVSLIEEAQPEIELLYKAVKVNKLSGHGSGLEKKWMKEALKKYDKDTDSFTVIERAYLEDSDLYFFTHGQEKRDFAGGILKRIAEKRNLSITGAQNLFKLYKALTD
jgi:hypothetical protein